MPLCSHMFDAWWVVALRVPCASSPTPLRRKRHVARKIHMQQQLGHFLTLVWLSFVSRFTEMPTTTACSDAHQQPGRHAAPELVAPWEDAMTCLAVAGAF